MKLRYYCEIFLICLLIVSCVESEKYVIETDISQLMIDTINGQTEKETREKDKIFYEELLSNTINRTIPDIEIFSIDGEKLNLRDVLINETIIISSDNHCGWGLECLTNDFPKEIKKIQNESSNFNIICLLKRENSDIKNPIPFNKTLDELKPLYETVYIIDDIEARKINLIPNPTRLYVNSDKVVKHIGIGTSLIENKLFNEIKENTSDL